MTIEHVVQPFEHISGIALRYGFRDYRTIWNHPANATLRSRRDDPHVLLAGDRVAIPERSERNENRATGRRHTFVLPAKPLRLNVHLLDESGVAVSDLPATLSAAGVSTEQKIGRDGRLTLTIPADAAQGRLLVNAGGAVKVRERSAGAGAAAP